MKMTECAPHILLAPSPATLPVLIQTMHNVNETKNINKNK